MTEPNQYGLRATTRGEFDLQITIVLLWTEEDGDLSDEEPDVGCYDSLKEARAWIESVGGIEVELNSGAGI